MITPNPPLRLLEKKIIFSTLVQYAGKAIQFVLAAVILKLISNFLSEGNYGIYATISEYALFFSMVANLGIFANIIRKMSLDPTNGRIFINSMYLRIVSALIFFVFGIIVLLMMGSSGVFILGTSLFLVALLLDFMTSVCDGMLQANYMMGRATIALLLGKIFTLVSLYLILKFFGHSEEMGGVLLIFLSFIIGSLITVGLSFYFVAKKITLQWKIDKHFVWNIFKDGLPFGIITIVNSLYFRFLPDYFIHRELTDAQFATFNISFRIAQVLSLFSTFLMFSALPGLREYISQKHWQKVRTLYSRILWVLAGSGALMVIFGSLLGPKMLTLLTHEKYFLPEFWYILPLMLLLAAISYGYDMILITLFAFDKNRWLLSREFVALMISLVFFAISLYVPGIHAKILLIIFGAIAGESMMVISGMLKTKKILDAV